MNYKKTILFLGFGLLAMQCEKIQGMEKNQSNFKEIELTFRYETYPRTTEIFSILSDHFITNEKEDQNSVISFGGTYATYDTILRPIEYTCIPKDSFDFTNLLFQIMPVMQKHLFKINHKSLKLITKP